MLARTTFNSPDCILHMRGYGTWFCPGAADTCGGAHDSGTRACCVMRRCRRPSVTFGYQMPRRRYVPTDAALQDRVIVVHAHAYPMRSDWTMSLDQYEALQTPLASRLGS